MRISLLRDSLILIGIFGAIWAIFTYFPIFSPKAEDFEISVEKEEKLGKVIIDNGFSEDDVTYVKDPLVDSAMFVIKQRLLDNIGPSNYEYNIQVIQDPQVNAFTLPGGNIFVYSGLIKFTESPEELAAVLAHEIGHAEKRHVVKKLAKELGITAVFTILSGGDPGMVHKLSKLALSTVFDREQEREADQYAFQLMEKSKIDPKALAFFFRRVKDTFKGYKESMEPLATHPHHNSRIKAALEYKLEDNFKSEPLRLNWKKITNSSALGK